MSDLLHFVFYRLYASRHERLAREGGRQVARDFVHSSEHLVVFTAMGRGKFAVWEMLMGEEDVALGI